MECIFGSRVRARGLGSVVHSGGLTPHGPSAAGWQNRQDGRDTGSRDG